MPNKNYIAGRNAEYLAKAELEKDGYTVIRASGSHGPYDLIAIPKKGIPGFRPATRCIQIKKVPTVQTAERMLMGWIGHDNDFWIEELWVRTRGRWHKGRGA